ncbi:hypothetical protein LIER_42846 [Lithospermum erythrorhizon]|uniref:Reverse transcriptase domain-containing protein n=1 Tax=Lithospermum erythrorhizon TaxID=34254 RepID=A0AAV3P284_LITER
MPQPGKTQGTSHRDHGSSSSNYAPSQTHRRAQSHSNDSHTRQPSHRYGSSNSSPKRSPRRETLRSYATRFEEVATNIPATNEKVTMISFFHGLRYGPLKE